MALCRISTTVSPSDSTQVLAVPAAPARAGSRLGIATHIHSATELLTVGIDVRTVAGCLGTAGGGATTLRVYAAPGRRLRPQGSRNPGLPHAQEVIISKTTQPACSDRLPLRGGRSSYSGRRPSRLNADVPPTGRRASCCIVAGGYSQNWPRRWEQRGSKVMTGSPDTEQPTSWANQRGLLVPRHYVSAAGPVPPFASCYNETVPMPRSVDRPHGHIQHGGEVGQPGCLTLTPGGS